MVYRANEFMEWLQQQGPPTTRLVHKVEARALAEENAALRKELERYQVSAEGTGRDYKLFQERLRRYDFVVGRKVADCMIELLDTTEAENARLRRGLEAIARMDLGAERQWGTGRIRSHWMIIAETMQATAREALKDD